MMHKLHQLHRFPTRKDNLCNSCNLCALLTERKRRGPAPLLRRRPGKRPMADESGQLSGRQQRVLAALLEAPTTRAAAERTGTSERTIRRRLAEPAILSAYRAARR